MEDLFSCPLIVLHLSRATAKQNDSYRWNDGCVWNRAAFLNLLKYCVFYFILWNHFVKIWYYSMSTSGISLSFLLVLNSSAYIFMRKVFLLLTLNPGPLLWNWIYATVGCQVRCSSLHKSSCLLWECSSSVFLQRTSILMYLYACTHSPVFAPTQWMCICVGECISIHRYKIYINNL